MSTYCFLELRASLPADQESHVICGHGGPHIQNLLCIIMRMKLLIVAISMFAATVYAQDATSLLQEAQQHYAQRETPGEIEKAIIAFERAGAADPKSYETAWKLSKAYWYQGNHSPADQKVTLHEKGITAGLKATEINAKGCEGHFWLGINYAMLAENSGKMKALGLIDDVKKEIHEAMAIDENCSCGGPPRVLGKLYAKIPWFKGGNKSKSIEALKRSIELCPDDTQSRIFLAEIYLEQGKSELALEQLNLVLKQEADPSWIPETKENKISASKMIEQLKKSKHAGS